MQSLGPLRLNFSINSDFRSESVTSFASNGQDKLSRQAECRTLTSLFCLTAMLLDDSRNSDMVVVWFSATLFCGSLWSEPKANCLAVADYLPRVCRATSYITTPAATETFSDGTLPIIGIDTR